MKALSIKQPWANMIACNSKTIETRTWRTAHRGLLLIVASKSSSKAKRRPVEPLGGHAIAVARLVGCRPMTPDDEPAAKCACYPGAYAWFLDDIRRIRPFPVKGRLKLYEVDELEDIPGDVYEEILDLTEGWTRGANV